MSFVNSQKIRFNNSVTQINRFYEFVFDGSNSQFTSSLHHCKGFPILSFWPLLLLKLEYAMWEFVVVHLKTESFFPVRSVVLVNCLLNKYQVAMVSGRMWNSLSRSITNLLLYIPYGPIYACTHTHTKKSAWDVYAVWDGKQIAVPLTCTLLWIIEVIAISGIPLFLRSKKSTSWISLVSHFFILFSSFPSASCNPSTKCIFKKCWRNAWNYAHMAWAHTHIYYTL